MGETECLALGTDTNRPLRPSGVPPRSGEDVVSEALKPRRRKHRTLGASDATVQMARRLRKQMSLPEVLLWRQLQQRPGGYSFRKQHPLGVFALDFVCMKARLAIEVDGMAHDMGDRPQRDEARDAWVAKKGFKTLRIPAADVLANVEGVVTAIVDACRQRAAPNPPRNGEVARRRRDGGAGLGSARSSESEPGSNRPLRPFGAPPRSGEDLP